MPKFFRVFLMASLILYLPVVAAQAQQELIYSVNRTPEPIFEVGRAADVITAEEIWRSNARTLPELLMQKAGIFVQQTNYGGGSVYIRGLIGKHILIFIDGTRVSNATYRFGPIQYLNTIDLSMVERVEIVRGVGSVLASALGGIINIITKKGPPGGQTTPFSATISSRFSSADDAFTGRAELFGSSASSRFNGGVTYRNSEDVIGGGNIGLQTFTGYDEIAGNLRAEFDVGELGSISVAYLLMEQDEVPRNDRLSGPSPRNLRFDFEPQRLQQATLSFEDHASRSFLDFLRVGVQWNKQDEGRLEIRSSRPDTERRRFDSQTLLEVNVELGSFIGENHRLLYGVDFGTEDITSTRVDVDLIDGSSSDKRGRYTDGAGYQSLGIYLQDRMRLGEYVDLTVGARFNGTWASGQETSSVGTLDLETQTSDVTGLANLVVHATPEINLVGNVARGFRAPNLDDISIFNEVNQGTEVPNPGVDPERVLTYEVGIKYSNPKFSASAFYYTTLLDDLLERAPGTLDGLSFFDLDGDGVQDADEPNILLRQNIGEATIRGVELEAQARPHPQVTLFGNFTYTRGDDNIANEPLRRIPPVFGTIGARWSSPEGLFPWVQVSSHFAGVQTRLNPEDISDSRIGPDGTPSFVVLNARGGVTVAEGFRLSLALENINDEAYKIHGSGVSRPGFQVVLGGEYSFNGGGR